FATGVGHPEAARGKSANERTRLDQDYGTATSSRLHGRDDPSRRAAINNDVVYRRVFDVRFGVQVLCDDGGGCQGKRQDCAKECVHAWRKYWSLVIYRMFGSSGL